jgi:hypothetical protein
MLQGVLQERARKKAKPAFESRIWPFLFRGVGRIRTAVDGFAIRCLATRPQRHQFLVEPLKNSPKNRFKSTAEIIAPRPYRSRGLENPVNLRKPTNAGLARSDERTARHLGISVKSITKLDRNPIAKTLLRSAVT